MSFGPGLPKAVFAGRIQAGGPDSFIKRNDDSQVQADGTEETGLNWISLPPRLTSEHHSPARIPLLISFLSNSVRFPFLRELRLLVFDFSYNYGTQTIQFPIKLTVIFYWTTWRVTAGRFSTTVKGMYIPL